jgi:hypothetical protein
MLGSRSGVIRVYATTPSTSTAITATKTVNGFFTLNLDINGSFMGKIKVLSLIMYHFPGFLSTAKV